jgi:hypothetical protein
MSVVTSYEVCTSHVPFDARRLLFTREGEAGEGANCETTNAVNVKERKAGCGVVCRHNSYSSSTLEARERKGNKPKHSNTWFCLQPPRLRESQYEYEYEYEYE